MLTRVIRPKYGNGSGSSSVGANTFLHANGGRLALGISVSVLLFFRLMCARQEHARTILPYLTALAGNEGADAWIGETMEIFNAATSRHMGEAVICQPTRRGCLSCITIAHVERSFCPRGWICCSRNRPAYRDVSGACGRYVDLLLC